MRTLEETIAEATKKFNQEQEESSIQEELNATIGHPARVHVSIRSIKIGGEYMKSAPSDSVLAKLVETFPPVPCLKISDSCTTMAPEGSNLDTMVDKDKKKKREVIGEFFLEAEKDGGSYRVFLTWGTVFRGEVWKISCELNHIRGSYHHQEVMGGVSISDETIVFPSNLQSIKTEGGYYYWQGFKYWSSKDWPSRVIRYSDKITLKEFADKLLTLAKPVV